MKECTYGWYPPAKDVWTHYRAKSNTYDEECRYKHKTSRYAGHPGVATPVPPKHIQLEISPSPRSPSPRVTSRPPSGTHSVLRIRPTPRKAWTSYVPPQTSMVPQPPSVSHQHTTASTPEGITTQQQYQRAQRVQSAHSHRPRTSPKPRPVKSAGPIRSPVTNGHQQERQHNSRETGKLVKSASMGEIKRPQSGIERSNIQRPQSCTTPERRLTTTPELPQHRDNEDYINRASPEPDIQVYRGDVYTPEPTTPVSYSAPPARQWSVYEHQLKEHGWRMEVPGDPLNLKTPCITKRLSYTTKVPIAPVAPEGPRGHMVNYDTYFYNTIPRRRATFDVAKDWASEVLHAKRMELQKRDGGIKYKYKNFSFVY